MFSSILFDYPDSSNTRETVLAAHRHLYILAPSRAVSVFAWRGYRQHQVTCPCSWTTTSEARSPAPLREEPGQIIFPLSFKFGPSVLGARVAQQGPPQLPRAALWLDSAPRDRRIAGVLVRDNPVDWSMAAGHEAELGPRTRRVEGVTEDDVFLLYLTGMAAIWSGHQMAPGTLSLCFGYVHRIPALWTAS